jgi:hypothetical protein
MAKDSHDFLFVALLSANSFPSVLRSPWSVWPGARLMREPVRPFEIEIIQALDDVFMKAAASPKDSMARSPSSGQTVTPAAFDAVFG